MTPNEVAERLLERDLAMMLKYAEKRMLPTRRIQMQIARLCQITAGDASKTLGEFLFDPPVPIDPAEEAHTAGETLADIGGGGRVYVLGRKKKARA